ncbi:MAG: hypothetical protein WBM44_21985, partial [Waterburya sp.]
NQIAGEVKNLKVDAQSLEISGGSFRPVLIFEQGVIGIDPESGLVRTGFINGAPLTPGLSVADVLNTFQLSQDEATSAVAFVPSLIYSESLQNAQGNNIEINTNELSVLNGGQLIARSFGEANAGNININQANTIDVKGASNTPGFAEQSFEIFSQINSITFGSGTGGDIKLGVSNLRTSDGGSISSVTNGSGMGGDVFVDSNTIDLAGSVPNVFLPSSIGAVANNEGDAGRLVINAENIFLSGGAAISTATFASGDAGEIEIKVNDSIEVTGIDNNSQLSSTITSAGGFLPAELREAFFLPPFSTGDAGNLNVSASEIKVDNAGQINVANFGTGNGGELSINANKIMLDSGGEISASTLSGEGGNITLNSENLQLLNQSQITASAGELGNGGNIDINSETIFGSGDSDITANAVGGNGGNIRINTSGLFFFPDSTIEASSELGVDGQVEINTVDDSLQQNLEPFDLNLATNEELFANSCLVKRNKEQGSFTIFSSGAVLHKVGIDFYDSETLTGLDDSVIYSDNTELPDIPPQSLESMIPGNKIITTDDGRILLVASPQSLSANSLICN